MSSDYNDRVLSRRHYRCPENPAWSFRVHVLADEVYLYIPTTGWGGAVAAVPEQEDWVREKLEREGVKPSWMGVWQLTLDALATIEGEGLLFDPANG